MQSDAFWLYTTDPSSPSPSHCRQELPGCWEFLYIIVCSCSIKVTVVVIWCYRNNIGLK